MMQGRGRAHPGMVTPGLENPVSAQVLRQVVEVAAISVLIWGLAAAHLAAVARPLFLVMALVLGYVSMRRSPWLYLTYSLWIWTVTPFLRRIVDYYGGFSAGSIMLLAPDLVILLMIWPVVTSSRLLRCREAGLGALLMVPVVYGLAVSFFAGDLYPGIIASIDWILPLFYFFYIIDLIPRVKESEGYFQYFVPLNLAVVSFYGIYQTFSPPDWDMYWVKNVRMFTMAGTGGGIYSVKPFSLLNSPGTCAEWVTFGILLSLHFRTKLTVFALPAALFFLLLTQVRANLGAVLLGFAVSLLFGHKQILKSVLFVTAVSAMVVAVLAAVNPHLADMLGQRFGSVSNLGQDRSAEARAELYRELPVLMSKYPLGLGIGAIGHGAVAASNGNTDGDLVSIDGGPVATYITLGWLAGTMYFGGILALVISALMAARRSRSPAALAFAIAALGIASTFAFTNLVGAQGMILWVPAALAIAIGAQRELPGVHEFNWRSGHTSVAALPTSK